MHGVDVRVQLVDRVIDVVVAAVGVDAHAAAEEVVLVRLVDVEEVLLEQAEVVEQLHLLAQHAAVDLDAVLLLQVAHVVVELDKRQMTLHTRVVRLAHHKVLAVATVIRIRVAVIMMMLLLLLLLLVAV